MGSLWHRRFCCFTATGGAAAAAGAGGGVLAGNHHNRFHLEKSEFVGLSTTVQK